MRYNDPFNVDQAAELTGAATLTQKEMVECLESMLRIRRAEEMIGDMVESGEAVCPCHLAIGQEGIPVAVSRLLLAGDAVFGAHRSHGHYFALGGDAFSLFAEVLGRAAGCSGGFGGSMHLRDRTIGLVGTVPIVGATIPIALGAALAMSLDGTQNLAVCYFGDGATEEGVFHESLNLAAVTGAPVVFLCEQNFFSSHLHILERQPSTSIARFGEAHGVDTVIVDGNDVMSMNASLTDRFESVRRESRPLLVEAVTYRWRGHVGHRDDIDVGVTRNVDLVKWKKRDPIQRMLDVARVAGVDLDWKEFTRTIDDELSAKLEEARGAPWPREQSLWDTVLPSTWSETSEG